MNHKIFISYRRSECQQEVVLLYKHLETIFGADSVFLDIDGIPPGEDFSEVLAQKINRCSIFLSLIGGDWHLLRDSNGRARINSRNDYVKKEIKMALDSGVKIIPVLLNGASMPDEKSLPKDIRGLSKKQAVQINTRSVHEFNNSVEILVSQIKLTEGMATNKVNDAAVSKLINMFHSCMETAGVDKNSYEYCKNIINDLIDLNISPAIVKNLHEKIISIDNNLKDYHVGYMYKDRPYSPKMVVLPKYLEGRRLSIGVHLVTFNEYDMYCTMQNMKRPSDSGWGRGDYPVINVSWLEVVLYCKWLSGITGKLYRLPSEEEWIFAYGNDDWSMKESDVTHAMARYKPKYLSNRFFGMINREFNKKWDAKTKPVGLYPSNVFGIYDMKGNVWEWTSSSVEVNAEQEKILKGGSWSTLHETMSASSRTSALVNDSSNSWGFRLICEII